MSLIVLLHVLLLLNMAQTQATSTDHTLEHIAWTFRFERSPYDSRILLPLQKTFKDAVQLTHANHALICIDECGPIKRLRMWGTPIKNVDPWFWPHSQNSSCRLHKAMAPLYDVSLQVDYKEGGKSWFRAHQGRYWKGCDLKPRPKDTSTSSDSTCQNDSSVFTNNEKKWLTLLRPIVATHLHTLNIIPDSTAATYSSQTEEPCIAPSLDRLLLVIARLACLSAANDETKQPAVQNVLVVGAGPVGLMTSIQARLTGSTHVTVWEKRSIRTRQRTNIVVLSESDQTHPEHPAALSLLENIGALQIGMQGTYRLPHFTRFYHEHSAVNDEDSGGEFQWALKLQIRNLEYTLQKITAILGTQLIPHTEFVRWEHDGTNWIAVGQQSEHAAVRLPVDVVVGADGEWSNVRTQGNFYIRNPKAWISLPKHCLLDAQDDLLVLQNNKFSEEDISNANAVQDVVMRIAHDCTETILEDDVDDDDNNDDDDNDDDDEDDEDEDNDQDEDKRLLASSYATVAWIPKAVSMQITIPVGCEDEHRERTAQMEGLLKIVATLYDDPAANGYCQITAIFKPRYGKRLMLKTPGNKRKDEVDDRIANETAMNIVSLLGYSPDVAHAAVLKVFAHSFHFASAPIKLISSPTKMTKPLIVALEGDAARQPFHQAGNGLNVGMFGSIDLADTLSTIIRQDEVLPLTDILDQQMKLATALTSVMSDESLQRAVQEVLFNQGSVEDRIHFNRWNAPIMHSGWHDYKWDELRSQDKHLWESLGWNRDRWKDRIFSEGFCSSSDQHEKQQDDGSLLSLVTSMWDFLKGMMVDRLYEKKQSDDVFIKLFCPHSFGKEWELLDSSEQQAAQHLQLSWFDNYEMWNMC